MSAFFLSHPKETDLALFAGGEAGPLSRWRIEGHLETCSRCEQAVADYFHLAEEISVLGDMPDMDWSLMAANIKARLSIEEQSPQPGRRFPAWTWQVGAAAACAMVAVMFFQSGPQAQKAAEPATEQMIAKSQPLADEIMSAPRAVDGSEAVEQPEPASQFTRLEAQASSEPMLERKKELSAVTTLALADRADQALSTDAGAPPPTVANAVSMETAASEADSAVLLAGERQRRESSGEVRSRLAATAAPSPAAITSGALQLAGNFGAVQPVSFSVMPLPAADYDQQVAADGWVSVRAINADGAMTITDVYEPQ